MSHSAIIPASVPASPPIAARSRARACKDDEPQIPGVPNLPLRAAITPPRGKPGHNNDNVIIKPEQGNSRAYTLDRLKRERSNLLLPLPTSRVGIPNAIREQAIQVGKVWITVMLSVALLRDCELRDLLRRPKYQQPEAAHSLAFDQTLAK
jgi:hypothetical protein